MTELFKELFFCQKKYDFIFSSCKCPLKPESEFFTVNLIEQEKKKRMKKEDSVSLEVNIFLILFPPYCQIRLHSGESIQDEFSYTNIKLWFNRDQFLQNFK